MGLLLGDKIHFQICEIFLEMFPPKLCWMSLWSFTDTSVFKGLFLCIESAEVAQWLRAHISPAEDLVSVHLHGDSRGSDSLFRLHTHNTNTKKGIIKISSLAVFSFFYQELPKYAIPFLWQLGTHLLLPILSTCTWATAKARGSAFCCLHPFMFSAGCLRDRLGRKHHPYPKGMHDVVHFEKGHNQTG